MGRAVPPAQRGGSARGEGGEAFGLAGLESKGKMSTGVPKLFAKIIQWVGASYTIIGMLLLYGGSFFVYVWSVKIAWDSGGFLSAAATLSVPVLAQIYWAAKIWYYTETICNWYTFAVISCALAGIVLIGGGLASEAKPGGITKLNLTGLFAGMAALLLILFVGFMDNGTFSTNKLQPISLLNKADSLRLSNYISLSNSFQKALGMTVKMRELHMLLLTDSPDSQRSNATNEIVTLIDGSLEDAARVSDSYLISISEEFKDKYKTKFQLGQKLIKQGIADKNEANFELGANKYDEFWAWFKEHGAKLVEKARPNQ